MATTTMVISSTTAPTHSKSVDPTSYCDIESHPFNFMSILPYFLRYDISK